MSKCKFGVEGMDYLGQLFLNVGPSKVKSMLDWSQPRKPKALRDFLWLTRYYRKLVVNNRLVEAPLTNLIRKNAFVKSQEVE